MSAVNLPELVAKCRSVRSYSEALNAAFAAGEVANEIIDALPVCPTCASWTDAENCCLPGQPCRICGVDADGSPCAWPTCPDCTDGRMDVFRALARLAELEAENKAPT